MNTPPDPTPALTQSAEQLAVPDLVIPVLVETATITRELVETGRVRLTKTVQEHEELVPLDLRHDQVQVERVAINQYLPDDAPVPETRHEGGVTIIPVLREVLVKRLLLVEELRVTRHQHTAPEVQRVVLRHEQVQVERLPPAAATDPANPPTFQP